MRDVPKQADPDLKTEQTLQTVTETPASGKLEAVQTSKGETGEDTPAVRMQVAREGVIFKVQIMASSKNLAPGSAEFKGLNKISKEPVNNLYRYLYGETDTYMGAKLLKNNADMKGFTTSYIVAYKDGKRIPLQDALKYEDE